MFDNALIGIIGGGNMGGSLVGGLIHHGAARNRIFVVDRNEEKRVFFRNKWGISSSDNIDEIAQKADILILAVKPNGMKATLTGIAGHLQDTPKLLISIAAGITTTQLHHWVGLPTYPIVRAMPNTPALFGQGVTGLFASHSVSPAQKQKAQELLSSVGRTLWLQDESLMDIVTALSGSGPAYFFYFMECLIKGAHALGLPEDIASELTLHTAMGSAYMAIHSQESLNALREKVTSPGGTTEQGIKALKSGNIEALLQQALEAANNRGKEISKLYD